jgi:chemotaxis protein CheX
MLALSLDPVLDLSAAMSLHSLLQRHCGQDVELNAGCVTRIGGHCLQVLLAAKRAWRAQGCKLQLTSPSDRCRDALGVVGATHLLDLDQ